MNQKNKSIGSENLIHIKLEYEEALQSKKDILSSEMGLLKIAKIIKRYHFLRTKELKNKLKLHKKIKETKSNIRKLQIILPKLKIPEILRKDDQEIGEIENKKDETKEKQDDESLELQLQEIRDKLKSLAT